MPFLLVVEDIPSKYRFCCCIHVRTGTLLLAIWQIIVHFVLITVLTAAIGKSPQFREEIEYTALSMSVMSFIQWEKFASASISVPSAQIGEANTSALLYSPDVDGVRRISRQYQTGFSRASKFFNAGEEYVAIVITLFSLLFSIMMLVGVINVKPFHLLPYCCLQFIDLFITSLSVIGFYTYLPEAKELLRSKLWISVLVVVLGFLLICLKGYFVLMVWLCYKFLAKSAAGLERSRGFSVAANSLCGIRNVVSFLTCHRQATGDRRLVTGGYGHSRRAEFNRVAGDTEPSNAHTDNNHLIVMLRSQQFGAPNSPSRPISVNHPCLPPKYEDVLVSPVGAFDPPPYWALDCSRLSNSTGRTTTTSTTNSSTVNPTTEITYATSPSNSGSQLPPPVQVVAGETRNQAVSSHDVSVADTVTYGGSVKTEPITNRNHGRHPPGTRHSLSSA